MYPNNIKTKLQFFFLLTFFAFLNTSLSFAQQPDPHVDSFTLVNATTGEEPAVYSNIGGAAVGSMFIEDASNISLRFDTNNSYSVKIGGDIEKTRIESALPFSFLIDIIDTYTPWSPGLGIHITVVEPFVNVGALGLQEDSATLCFSVSEINACVVPNDSTRVYADYLDYQVGYSKGLKRGNKNQAWKLNNNWHEGVVLGRDNLFGDSLKYVTTFNNGRTYIWGRNTSQEDNTRESELFELVGSVNQASLGVMRGTGVTFNDNARDLSLKGDGRITWTTVGFFNGITRSILNQQKIIGFTNGDSMLGPVEVFGMADRDNELFTNGAERLNGEVTESGAWLIFSGFNFNSTARRENYVTLLNEEEVPPIYAVSHLGGVKKGINKLSFAIADTVERQLFAGVPFR